MKQPIPAPITLASPRAPADDLRTLLGIEECVRYYPPNLEPVADPAAILGGQRLNASRREIDIFLDVPFCSTICGFCPFNVYPYAQADVASYLEALEREVTLIKSLHDLSGTKVRTIWVGGGTPSLLDDDALDWLLGLLAANFDLTELAEFTVEVKPTLASLTEAKFDVLRKSHVDRISMGVQSTHEEFLRILGRGYTAAVASEAIRRIKDAGFILNIDMMYRLPGQTMDQVSADVHAIRSLGVDHVSWFPYVPHAGTPLADRIERGRVAQQGDRREYLDMFKAVADSMTYVGYRQYTPYYFTQGDPCEYHVGRWRMPQRETLGIGAGAFAFFNGWIYANEHDPAKYRHAVDRHVLPVMRAKKLTTAEWITRLAVLGVHFFTINLADFERHSGVAMQDFYKQELEILQQTGLVEVRDGQLDCTLLGRAFNNDIATVLGTDTSRRTRHPQAIDLMRAKL